MAGILANILAGGVGGGAKAYTDGIDDRKKEALEKAKEAALYERQKNLMILGQKYQDKVRSEEQARRTGKENIADSDARNIAALLANKEHGEGTGILSEVGGDEYSAPMTEEDILESTTGAGRLAYEEKRLSMEQQAKKQKYDMEQDALENAREDKKLAILGSKKNKKDLSAKEEQAITDMVKDSVYSSLGYTYDDTLKDYIKPDGTTATSGDKVNANKTVNEKTVEVIKIKKDDPGMTVAEALASLENKQLEQLNPIIDALKNGDVSALDKMDDATLAKTIGDLATYLGTTKNNVIAEIKKLRKETDPPPKDPPPQPGILSGSEEDKLAPKPSEYDDYYRYQKAQKRAIEQSKIKQKPSPNYVGVPGI